MDWRTYEKEIFNHYKQAYPKANILFDQSIVGKFSKVPRQIDILIEGIVAGYSIRIVIDCKFFSKSIDVNDVGEFASALEDIGAHQGVLITQAGYSSAALTYATSGRQQIELDIINFKPLERFQSFIGLPYSGTFAVQLPAPFGWVIDIKNKVNRIATLYQRGLTLKQAENKNEWMYLNFFTLKSLPLPIIRSIDELIELQNYRILHVDSKSTFQYDNTELRTDKYQTKVRIAEIPSYPALEVTGFIQFRKHILFIVLFTPKALLAKNLRKLKYVLSLCKPGKIEFRNEIIILQLKTKLKTTSDKNQRALLNHKLGIFYKEMNKPKSALPYFRKSLRWQPSNYEYLKHIILEELLHGTLVNSLKYASHLYELAPSNPAVTQDLLHIFINFKKSRQLLKFFSLQIQKQTSDHALGNLHFHLGFLKLFLPGGQEDAFKDFHQAKIHFRKVFPDNHEVFGSLDQFEKDKVNYGQLDPMRYSFLKPR